MILCGNETGKQLLHKSITSARAHVDTGYVISVAHCVILCITADLPRPLDISDLTEIKIFTSKRVIWTQQCTIRPRGGSVPPTMCCTESSSNTLIQPQMFFRGVFLRRRGGSACCLQDDASEHLASTLILALMLILVTMCGKHRQKTSC